MSVQPVVPGFVITGGPSASPTGSTWAAMRRLDDHHFALKIVAVAHLTEAQALAARQVALLNRIESECVIRLHGAIALADGTLALVLDEVTGGDLTHVLDARGQLSAGETVTTVAPLFRALADLHAAGVVHGDLGPGNVLFTSDGRPLLDGLGLASLQGRLAGPFDGGGRRGFVAPELIGSTASASPASDVFAMAALGWFCLVGTPPEPAATRASLAALRPEVPSRLVEVLISCLAVDPVARPSAAAAAIEVFDSAAAESVALASASDPAAEITRRIRAAAVSAPTVTSPPTSRGHRRLLVTSLVVLVVAVALGSGASRFWRPAPTAVQSVTASSTPRATPRASTPVSTKQVSTNQVSITAHATSAMFTRPGLAPPNKLQVITDVVAAPDSPRVAAAALLQALVDARALAYVARDSALLDLVYAPGSTKADLDKDNIATAIKNGGTYLRLSFVITNAAFLDGTSDAARIRATIVTPAYQTGQPDGRQISHRQDRVGPCVFTLRMTTNGWRILGLTAA